MKIRNSKSYLYVFFEIVVGLPTVTTGAAVVSAETWPVLKLGGLGASYIGPLLGFGATGVVKGSLAALAQSSIPNVVAGSLFSGMQAATTTSAVVAGSGNCK